MIWLRLPYWIIVAASCIWLGSWLFGAPNYELSVACLAVQLSMGAVMLVALPVLWVAVRRAERNQRRDPREELRRPGSARRPLFDLLGCVAIGAGWVAAFSFLALDADARMLATFMVGLFVLGSAVCARKLWHAIKLSPLPWATSEEAVRYHRQQLDTRFGLRVGGPAK